MPTPNISAKNISDRIAPLLLAAASTLDGTMDRNISSPVGWFSRLATICELRCAFSASIAWAIVGSTPAPGWNRLTMTRPMTTAVPDSSTVYPRVFQPMRPSALTSPISATPTTSAENISGTISMKIRFKKMVDTGVVSQPVTWSTQAASAAKAWASSPNNRPSAKPMPIFQCSGMPAALSCALPITAFPRSSSAQPSRMRAACCRPGLTGTASAAGRQRLR